MALLDKFSFNFSYFFYFLSLKGFWHAHTGDENEVIRDTLKSISQDLDDMTYLRPAWKKVKKKYNN